MPIRRTDRNTGIYNQFVISSGENPTDMAAVMNMFAQTQNRSVMNFIDDTESEVKRILADPKAMDTQKSDARQVQTSVTIVRSYLSSGVPIEALAAAFRMGREAERLGIREFEPHAVRGMKTLRAAKDGHVATHGTKLDREERNQKIRAEYERRLKLPEAQITSIEYDLAKQFGFKSPKTIRRALEKK